MFNARITYLHASAVLAILEHRVMQIQFVFCVRDDIVSTEACVVKLAGDPKVPIVIRLINQRRLRKNRLEAELVTKEPDDAATRCHRGILINSPAQSDNGKDLVFL